MVLLQIQVDLVRHREVVLDEEVGDDHNMDRRHLYHVGRSVQVSINHVKLVIALHEKNLLFRNLITHTKE